MKGSWRAYALSAVGMSLVLVAALADQLGLGGSRGLGPQQVLGMVVGWTLLLLGLCLALSPGGWKQRSRVLIMLAALTVWLLPIVSLVVRSRWQGARDQATAQSNDRFPVDALIAIGYLDWSEDVADPRESGVLRWDRSVADPGYTLISSRERPEVYLLDMSGRIVHTWSLPDTEGRLEGARLLDDGDLLIISKFHEIVRLSWHSEVIWRTALDVHHDVTVMPDGHLYTWVREIQPFRGLQVRFPSLAKLSEDGRVIDRWSTRDHLREIRQAFDDRSFLDRRLFHLHFKRVTHWLQGRLRPDRVYDFFHPNSVQLIGPNANHALRAFRPGNLVICLRNINQIATMDPATMELLWTWGEGELDMPHHPTVLENGNILIFDNGTVRGFTRILEIDPVAGSIEWQYPAEPADPEHHFFAAYKGSAQRLGNGNTLIGDGENGRAVEVTPEGEIVWEFFYPEIGEKGQRAMFYRSIRYPPSLVDGLIATRGANLAAVPDWWDEAVLASRRRQQARERISMAEDRESR